MNKSTRQALFIVFYLGLALGPCTYFLVEHIRQAHKCDAKGGLFVGGRCLDVKTIPL